jgi:hypothetical protein
VRLVNANRQPGTPVPAQEAPEQTDDPLAEALARGPALKEARNRALVAALHPREQPRDQAGRFTDRPSAGFDGGARAGAPPPSDPIRDHDRAVAQLAGISRASRGSGHSF